MRQPKLQSKGGNGRLDTGRGYFGITKIVLLIGVLFFLPHGVPAQGFPNLLPRSVMTALQSDYPGWHVLDNTWVLHTSVAKLDTSQARPNVVWGDFDGDGHLDFALLIARGKGSQPIEEKLVAYLVSGDSLRRFDLADAVTPAHVADMIWISLKGTRKYDYNTDRFFRLKNDAIDAITLEKAASTYIFEKDRFRVITSED